MDESRTNYRGEALQSPFYVNRAEHVAPGEEFDFDLLPFRDLNCFIAGNLHKHYEEWEKLNPNGEILSWLRDGVNIENFFTHFKGNFAGKCYDSPSPTKEYFRNSDSSKKIAGFIKETVVGSMSVWGRVGECDPPHLVMPLTIEPSKPRLCHDERFLNLWIIDKPFTLDTLKDIPRLIAKGSFMTSVDDK